MTLSISPTRWWPSLWFFIVSTFLGSQVLAATVSFSGPVNSGSVQRLIQEIKRSISSGSRKVLVNLESEGGEIPPAIRAAQFLKTLRASGIHVVTSNRSFCESSCTIIYAAGQTRMASSGATFYFHQVGVRGNVSSERREQIRRQWAKSWLDEIRRADPRLASELEAAEVFLLRRAERTYYAGALRPPVYSFVNQ